MMIDDPTAHQYFIAIFILYQTCTIIQLYTQQLNKTRLFDQIIYLEEIESKLPWYLPPFSQLISRCKVNQNRTHKNCGS